MRPTCSALTMPRTNAAEVAGRGCGFHRRKLVGRCLLWTLSLLATIFALTALPLYAVNSTTTTLSISDGSVAVVSQNTFFPVMLTATVESGGAPVMTGQVNFCTTPAPHCNGTHLLGTAQLTANGTASMWSPLPAGPDEIVAVFVGTNSYTSSTSTPYSIDVTAWTSTTTASSGSAGKYTFTSTVTGQSSTTPLSSTVSYVDASNGNQVLATAPLGASTFAQTFQTSSNIYLAASPTGGVMGDFNGDGLIDMALPYGDYATILLNSGSGYFWQTYTPYLTGPTNTLAVGDFNGDGLLDLAAVDSTDDIITILQGAGDGTFVKIKQYPTSGYPLGLVAGDFNRDGIVDLAYGGTLDGSVHILLGDGTGGFRAESQATQSLGVTSLAVGDYNGDGILDLAVGESGTHTVIVLQGIGDGTFTNLDPISVGADILATVDWNNDGIADLVTTGVDGQSLVGLTSNGDGTFHHTELTTFTGSIMQVAPADFSGDGIVDLAVLTFPASSSSTTVQIFNGKGDGTFTSGPSIALPYGFAIAVGDLDADGIPDLTYEEAGGTMVSLLNKITETASTAATAVTVTGAGQHKIEPSYSGDSTYAPSTANSILLGGAAPSSPVLLSISPSQGPMSGGTMVTIKGQHFTGTQWIEFGSLLTTSFTVANDSTIYVTAPAFSLAMPPPVPVQIVVDTLDGITSSLNAGVFTYAGGPLTATVLLSNLNQTYTGSRLPVSASTFSGGLPIRVTYSGSTIPPTAAGSYSIVATVDAPGYNGSATGMLIINKASQSINFPALPETENYGASGPLTLAATATSGLPVSYSVTGPATISGNTLTLTGASVGFVTVTASQAGDSNHLAAASVTQSFYASSLYSSYISVQYGSTQLTYPGATNITVCISPAHGITPAGIVYIFDGIGTAPLTTLTVQGNGCAYWYISPGLSAGQHAITAIYVSSNAYNPGARSTPTTINVAPVPVSLSPSCWLTASSYGANYQCTVSLSSNAGVPKGVITYSLDGAATVPVTISNGAANFTLTTPAVGDHSLVIAYVRQTNFAAAGPATESFTIAPTTASVKRPPGGYISASGD